MRPAGFGGSGRRKRTDLIGPDECPTDIMSHVSSISILPLSEILMVPTENWTTGPEAPCKR